jgi:DNA polymerase III alpha subunit
MIGSIAVLAARSRAYVHESMERYTKDTYGIIVYQEQVMICVREIGLIILGRYIDTTQSNE